MGTAGVSSDLTCEAINGNAAGVSSSAPVVNDSSEAWGGSSSREGIAEGKASGGSGSEMDTSDKAPVDDSASETQSFEDTDMGGTGGGGG
ncbi:hypothetical protein DB31_6971 [Hyalangium minutum]|uniref:Uncharacterized protein n=2 Tax=Hyalangium minutum TaxID=394096 RepID=A0A085WN06_9BACT|nr:hypothetical protein DB31_6971 [Hyalangium minutum]